MRVTRPESSKGVARMAQCLAKSHRYPRPSAKPPGPCHPIREGPITTFDNSSTGNVKSKVDDNLLEATVMMMFLAKLFTSGVKRRKRRVMSRVIHLEQRVMLANVAPVISSDLMSRAGFKTCLQGFQAGRRRMVVFYNRLSTMTMQAA